MKLNPFNRRIGLALGGGAAKGMAHIGVLKAMEENGLDIEYISGTSIGALVASYYAFGKSIDSLEAISKDMSFSSLIGFKLQKQGIFSTKSVREMIVRDLGEVYIEQARIPLAICTTDIKTGEQVILKEGKLADAICASMAVPGVFIPVEIHGRQLVDGGITENVPVSILDRMGAGITIAVDLNGSPHYQEPKDIIAIMGNAIDIAIDLRTKEQISKADLILSMDLANFSRMGNEEEFEELRKLGYEEMNKKLNQFFWYRKIRYFFYLKKILLMIAPIKIPDVLRFSEKLKKRFLKK
jgi:NTE family protein|tara:strand:+ start:510 stop:1400 length:891 start_codon:yes stop_codon:yes gene_type:complete